MRIIKTLRSIEAKIFSDERIEFATVVAFCLLLTLFIFFNIDKLYLSNPSFSANIGDHQKYLYMAQHDPTGLYFAPFGWRIGLPTLVKILPLGAEQGFLGIGLFSIIGTGVVLYYILKRFIPDWYVCLTGILFYYGLGWIVFIGIYDFWLTDALAIFMMVLAFYFTIIKNDLGFFAAIFFGIFVKESVLLVIPIYYMYNCTRLIDFNVLKRLALLVIPCLAVLMGIRLMIPAYSMDTEYLASLSSDLQQSDYNAIESYREMLELRAQQFSSLDSALNTLPVYLLDPLGVTLFALSVIGVCVKKDEFYKLLPFIATVFLSLFLGGDTSRYLVLMFPAAIILACYAMVWAREQFAIRLHFFAVAALLILLLHTKWYFSVPVQIEVTVVVLGLLSSFVLDKLILSSDSVLKPYLNNFLKYR